MKCPKCHYIRKASDNFTAQGECPKCGIYYEKYQAYLENQASIKEAVDQSDDVEFTKFKITTFVKESFLYCPESTDSIAYYARLLCAIVFFIWGMYFIFNGINEQLLMSSFMHNINLVFHEAGHMIFIPFGRFMTILGGSLFQVLLPFAIMLGFIFKQKENFGAAIMMWWTGQSMIDVSPYIDDAIERELPLIGGMGEHAHDWGNLLRMTDSLEHTHFIAGMCFTLGAALIVGSFIWCAYYLIVMKSRIREF